MDRVDLLASLSARIREDRFKAEQAQRLGEIRKRWRHIGRAEAMAEIMVMLGGSPPPGSVTAA